MNSNSNDTIRGAVDLYAALRAAAARTPGLTLETVLAGLDAGDATAQETATRLRGVDQALLAAILRKGSGTAAIAAAATVKAHLASLSPAQLFLPPMASSPTRALLTAGQLPDMPAFSDRRFDAWFAAQGVTYGLGAYGEKRSVYAADQFADVASPERRMIHMGIDVFAPAGTQVYAPLDGVVRSVVYNADPLDYGHTLIMEHRAGDQPFFTLYGHLAASLQQLCKVGQTIRAGQHIADLGDWHENGGWGPHIHFQIMTDMLHQTGGNFFGVAHESLWDIWQEICPDPNLILRLSPDLFG